MVSGTVKFYNRTKRYGFIAQDDGDDVFFHETGIEKGPIFDNDRVEFDIEESERGPKAVNVKKV